MQKINKFLFIITQSEFGGAQKNIYYFAKYFHYLGHFVKVVAGQGDQELFSKLEQQKIDYYFLKHLRRRISPLDDFKAYLKIKKIIQQQKPDTLILASTKAAFLGSLAGKSLKIPKIIHYVGGWAFNEDISWLRKNIYLWAERFTNPCKHKIIVNCQFDYDIALAKKITPEKKMSLVYNGLDLNIPFLSKEKAREKLGLKDKKIIIGSIANFYKNKGLIYLIKTATQIKREDIFFVIIGDGEQRKELEKLINQYDLKHKFLLLGRKDNAAQYLKAFDIFVLASLKEGLPWVILEAMAAQLPIIATRINGIPEIITHQKNGLLVPPKKPDKLKEEIVTLLKRPQLAQQLAFQAFHRIQSFSLEKMLKSFQKSIFS